MPKNDVIEKIEQFDDNCYSIENAKFMDFLNN